MAVKRWIGNALPVAQVTTIAVTGTWATNDVAVLTINGKNVELTVGSDSAVADVAAALAAMVNGDSLESDESRNATGDAVGEFVFISATSNGGTLTLTGDQKGVPFTVAAGETTAGDGGLGTPVETIAADGPQHFDNADNWSPSGVPATDDEIVFDSGDGDLLFGLAQSSITPAAIRITADYQGRIGLPDVNQDDRRFPYREYRETFLKLGNAAAAKTTTVTVGEGDGPGSSRIRLDTGDGKTVLHVLGGGPREASDPPLLWRGTHAENEVNAIAGDLGIAARIGESAHVDQLRVGSGENASTGASVVCGEGVDLTDADVRVLGGRLEIASATTGGTIEVAGGELVVAEGAHADLSVDGGRVDYRSAETLTSVSVGGGRRVGFLSQRPESHGDELRAASRRSPARSASFGDVHQRHRPRPSVFERRLAGVGRALQSANRRDRLGKNRCIRSFDSAAFPRPP